MFNRSFNNKNHTMKKKTELSDIVAVDLGLEPKIPKRLSLKRNNGNVVIHFNLRKFKTIDVSSKLKPGESFINLEETIKRFHRNRKNLPVNAKVLDEMIGHFDKIPKKLSKPGTYLLFLETTYLTKKGVLCIRALNYAEKWYETVLVNSDRFSGRDLVVCI